MFLFTVVCVGLSVLSLWAFTQKSHAGLRILGPIYLTRFIAEWARPKITQYLERQGEGRPYALIKREWVYKASKGLSTYQGFGTSKDLHKKGTHVLIPAPFGLTSEELPENSFTHQVGGYQIKYPAMRSGGSFGAFGAVWTRSVSDGSALLGEGFLDNTGEGGLAPHHCPVNKEGQRYLDALNKRIRKQGHKHQFRFDQTVTSSGSIMKIPLQLNHFEISSTGRAISRKFPIIPPEEGEDSSPLGISERNRNLIVQIGPSLSGFRLNGSDQLDWKWLEFVCSLKFVRGIEIKIAQGAKPNDGGRVSKEKLTTELRALRNFSGDSDYVSPERHPFIPSGELKTQVKALIEFIERIKALPTFTSDMICGVKITYTGKDFISALGEHLQQDKGPHYLVVDGAEGGTGAGDPIMTDRLGHHNFYGIEKVNKHLCALGVRDKISLVASGRLADPGDIALVMSLGADYVNILRGFMFSTGCIQARECHSGSCPAGITTHKWWHQRGLDPTLKSVRFANYAIALRKGLVKIARSTGVSFTKGEKFSRKNLHIVE